METKKRKELIADASKLKPLFNIGKSGLSRVFIEEIDKALGAREIIKIEVNRNSFLEAKNVAEELSTATGSEIVLVIGRKIILYRENQERDE
ncbi:YhbY family RNA-binding protein [candidate division WOR-3 bacterium]|nr:YhbY family RNA-binding protein [candidate division WOR-3 bacterium]